MIGAVSPATRAIPRIEEVKIPGNAYGKTFFRMVCHLVAPSASEPSRNPCGTARNDSSLAVMMAGKTIKPSVNQPESNETFQPKKITNNPNPKSPNTIDGTPARLRIAIRKAQKSADSRNWLRRRFAAAAIISTDTHPVTRDQSLREIVDPKSQHKENESDHEKSPIMDAATHYFAHFLRDDAGHSVHRLEKRAEALGKIRDRDPISGAE